MGRDKFMHEGINTAPTEKEIFWKTLRSEVDEIVDAKGMPIDEGIKETVAAFNAVGINTTASCEGHEDTNIEGGGRVWPWVAIEAPEEPHPRFEGEVEIFEKIAEANGVTVEDLKRGRPRELWDQAMNEVVKNPETPEYKEWERKNKELYESVSKLLNEFYEDRDVDEGVELKLEEFHGSSFEISSESDNSNLLKLMDGELTPEERADLAKKLPKRREEMAAFTEFLKNKFFNELGDQVMQERSERMFKEYVKDLDLTEEDLVKVILDVGADTAEFARYLERKELVIKSTVLNRMVNLSREPKQLKLLLKHYLSKIRALNWSYLMPRCRMFFQAPLKKRRREYTKSVS